MSFSPPPDPFGTHPPPVADNLVRCLRSVRRSNPCARQVARAVARCGDLNNSGQITRSRSPGVVAAKLSGSLAVWL